MLITVLQFFNHSGEPRSVKEVAINPDDVVYIAAHYGYGEPCVSIRLRFPWEFTIICTGTVQENIQKVNGARDK